MKKLIYYVIGIIVLINLALFVILFVKINKIEIPSLPSFSGTTNFDSLELSETLTVTGTSTLTGALSVAGNLNADGGIVKGGVHTFAEGIAAAITAAIACDHELILAEPEAGTYTSISLPSDSTLIADCMGSIGDHRTFFIGNISTSSTAVIDLLLPNSIAWTVASATLQKSVNNASETTKDELIIAEVWNLNNTSLSWKFDAITASAGN